MLSINQLVPLPVVGEQQEIVVGELHARPWPRLPRSGMTLILPSSVKRNLPLRVFFLKPEVRSLTTTGSSQALKACTTAIDRKSVV